MKYNLFYFDYSKDNYENIISFYLISLSLLFCFYPFQSDVSLLQATIERQNLTLHIGDCPIGPLPSVQEQNKKEK